MICPNCKKQDFDKAIFNGVEVDYCVNCLGIWFDDDELRQAKDERDENLSWLDVDLWHDKTKLTVSKGERLCPYCRMPLYEVFYGDSDIKVDLCNLCHGLWLDRGEFKGIIEYLKKELGKEVLDNYRENLANEAWEIFFGPETFREEVADFLAILKLLNYKLVSKRPGLVQFIASLPR